MLLCSDIVLVIMYIDVHQGVMGLSIVCDRDTLLVLSLFGLFEILHSSQQL